MRLNIFKGSFTQQEPISEEGIAAAVKVLRSGRLHRYNAERDELSEASLLEREFAAYQGSRYALACSSGGYALHIALRAAGLRADEPVLTNAFTLAPVPGAIVNAGGRVVLVETTMDLVPDLVDLEQKASKSGARFMVLSYMRGHMPDMDALMELTGRLHLTLIEDCAHTMGASWDGRKSGSFGLAGCFSTQTYKHINSGEGGLLMSDDPAFMGRAILMSGSYMLYERHGAAPEARFFSRAKFDTPNFSGRMDNVRAAILRAQIPELVSKTERWNKRYQTVEACLRGIPGVYLPNRPLQERYVGSSIQFLFPGISAQKARAFVSRCAKQGVEISWFGDAGPKGFTSSHRNWRYLDPQSLPHTDATLASLFDMRLPLTFSIADCRLIGNIILRCLEETCAQ
ncbi:DegT/DnrJ/EryC1/StrS family aminotransferase [Candidimonas nitroreducens]|uniref:Aminotransferase n=1 Tax=Candidimonas nitroreducens TaxID=683354 RepID=A0A225MKZ0_9BURK|nr:DegT/DnrJ/EryC1/StrS aminotransferase family protein [Candidimonas nitroreducens]OWT60191.1 aminotransferase [Candidimonas nitroreducens]